MLSVTLIWIGPVNVVWWLVLKTMLDQYGFFLKLRIENPCKWTQTVYKSCVENSGLPYSVYETLADVKTLVFLLTVPCLSGFCLISWIRLIEQEPLEHDYWAICSLRQPHNSVG